MRSRAGALVFLAVAFGATACGSGHAAPSVPSKNGSYAWQPVSGGPSLRCTAWNVASHFGAHSLIDFRSRPYYCKLPAPADSHRDGAYIDFFGPTTTAAGAAPLGPHALRIYMNVSTPRPAILRVDFGDGSHWQRTVTRGGLHLNVVHSYAPTSHAFILVTLRDKTGYLAVEGEGPFRAPLPGPRTRYCSRVTSGKGGWLTATTSLTCAEAERLFSSSENRKLHGYRCVETGLGPYGSDTGVWTCRRGAREFVYTSVP